MFAFRSSISRLLSKFLGMTPVVDRMMGMVLTIRICHCVFNYMAKSVYLAIFSVCVVCKLCVLHMSLCSYVYYESSFVDFI